MVENEMILPADESSATEEVKYENVFRRGIMENPKEKLLAQHRLWLATIQHEYPMPYIPYKIGVYIRFFNQTQYSDEVYLSKHKQWFLDDIALCPRWSLVDFYIDYGSRAPHMESSKEWCRLLEDCLSGRVNLIVTQKAGNISDDPQELTFICRLLATQNPPVAVYMISEDVFTLASYYREDMTDRDILPEGWQVLPEDELDRPLLEENDLPQLSAEEGNTLQEGGSHAGVDS